MAGPYALYLGKLAPNKGTTHLVDVVERAGSATGRSSSPATGRIARGARGGGVAIAPRHSHGRLGRSGEQTVAWLAHASLLIFPSRGPESLSRVLLEASALGVPIAAMNTGGTPDIIDARSHRPAVGDAGGARRRCRAGCGRTRRCGGGSARPRGGTTERSFDAPAVVARVERLYADLLGEAAAVMRALRVAVVARSVFPLHGVGGLERHVYDLVRYLAARASTSR